MTDDGVVHDGREGHDGHHHLPGPPSAAGHLEPYGVRVSLLPARAGFDPQPFLLEFLGTLAAGCVDSGATVIGHLKCFLHLPGGGVACNLTSLRSGATCSVQGAVAPVALPIGEAIPLDLAVLVYGLPTDTVGALVCAELSRLLDRDEVSWSLAAGGAPPR
jgi:hypothetical protein